MANKHLKRCLRSYNIKKLHIKMRLLMHGLEWLTSITLIMPNTAEKVKQQELTFTAGGCAKATEMSLTVY